MTQLRIIALKYQITQTKWYEFKTRKRISKLIKQIVKEDYANLSSKKTKIIDKQTQKHTLPLKMITASLTIIGRYFLAFLLSMIPIMIGLKDWWYVNYLVAFNFIIQFVFASIQNLPEIKFLLKK